MARYFLFVINDDENLQKFEDFALTGGVNVFAWQKIDKILHSRDFLLANFIAGSFQYQ